MSRAAFALVFALMAAPVSGQSHVTTIDLSAFGWGTIDVKPAETDGDTTTEEWVVRKLDVHPNQWRVVLVRANGLCAGDWFSATSNLFTASEVSIVRGRSVLKIGTFPVMTIVSLDTPTACATR